MSDENQLSTLEGCGADVAAYALGALEPAEADAFELHLERCAMCAEDLGAFKLVADSLAMSAHQHPVPPGLRRRVIDSVRSEPRLDATARRERGFLRLIAPRMRIAAMAVTTATAIGIAVAVIAVTASMSGGSSQVRVFAASVVDSRGSAQVRLAGGRAELVVRNFPPPPDGLIYEVWLKRPGRALAATPVLFSVTTRGASDIGVPGEMRGVSEILVTPEPAGGSTAPTHKPVIVARLS